MPWGRLDDSLYDHQKLDDLPTDDASVLRILESMEPAGLLRLAALGLWARTISWSNRFLTDGQAPRSRIQKLDGSPELADALVGAGLFEEAGHGYAVHDFLQFNDSRIDVLARREADKERQRNWRAKKGEPRSSVSHSVTANGDEPDVTDGVTDGVTPSVTPLVTASSRARDVARIPARPGPAHESLPERIVARRRPTRADIAALHDRGWKRVTKAQRQVLDEILARHDVTGPEFAAAAIRATPPDRDPLDAVMTADRMWQESRRRQADADERRAKTERTEEAVPWLR